MAQRDIYNYIVAGQCCQLKKSQVKGKFEFTYK